MIKEQEIRLIRHHDDDDEDDEIKRPDVCWFVSALQVNLCLVWLYHFTSKVRGQNVRKVMPR